MTADARGLYFVEAQATALRSIRLLVVLTDSDSES
jgi:hypothetical protein